ncbi:MAG: hypothetical protein JNL50_13995 [Phycisphaerae bacterium]|nr:hypothetical protein [Phycisphaerae bacterium]
MSKGHFGAFEVPRGERAVSLVVEIGLIGFVWWYLGLAPLFAGLLLALVIVSEFLGVGWSRLVSGVGLIGLGLLARSYYGQPVLGTVLSVLGVAMAVIGAIQLRGVMAAKRSRDSRE